MDNFNKELYESVIIPIFNDILAKNILQYGEKFNYKFDLINISNKKEDFLKNIRDTIYSYNIESQIPSREELDKLVTKLLNIELLFYKIIIENDKGLDDKTRILLFDFIAVQTFLSSFQIVQLTDINFYIDFSQRIINFYDNKKEHLNENDRDSLNNIKRCLYTTINEVRLDAKKEVYDICTGLAIQDIKYSREKGLTNYTIALNNFVNIGFDHLFLSINNTDEYIDQKKLNEVYELLLKISKNIANVENNRYLLFKIFLTFFRKDIYELKIKINKKIQIDEEYKKILLIKCSNLIKIFYGDNPQYEIFSNNNHPAFSISNQEALKNFSKDLAVLLNDSANNNINVLFNIFNFLNNFPQFLKLNIAIYKRIDFISQKYFNKRIYVISKIFYLKALNNIENFKNEILKVKFNVENKPTISLISIYNNEISMIKELPPITKEYFKISPYVIPINEKIFSIKKIIHELIAPFEKSVFSSKEIELRLKNFSSFQNEINNIFNVVSDVNILKDFAQFYSNQIDSFIKSEELEYREDYVEKATALKMLIFDINPYNFLITLLYSKLGKLKLIINHPDPEKLHMQKKHLSNTEKEEVANFINLSVSFLPKDGENLNWNSIENSIINLRNPAIEKNRISPAESRILKVISAIINKITRLDIDVLKVFPSLFEESFVAGKRIWDLDPVIISYFSNYFSKKPRLVFFIESTGERIEIKFNHISNSLITEKINQFIKDLIDNTKIENLDAAVYLQELMDSNTESLNLPDGNKKTFAFLEANNLVKTDKTVFYESWYIGKEEKIYLFDVMKNILQIIGNGSLFTTLKFILIEFFNNANKSALKRAYFSQRNLDIDLKYNIGMINFSETLKSDNLINLLITGKKIGLKIKTSFQVLNNFLNIKITNNIKIHPEEIKLINEAVQKARKCNNLKDIYKNTIDTKEGKGEGIVLSLMLMKKFNSTLENFKVKITDNETTFSISLPFSAITDSEKTHVSEELLKEIDNIPLMPENVNMLKILVNDPKSNIEQIESLILKDPGLSADILKYANSSYYMAPNPINTIRDGIKILGMKGLKNILLAASSYRLLEKKGNKERIDSIIKHSEIAAIYAKYIIQLKELDVNVEDIYLAVLLHDIGKIVVEGISPDIYKNIQSTFSDKQIPIEVLEDVAGGINHSEIGYLVTKKWNFPDNICEVIRCHHDPRSAKNFPQAVFTGYLANVLTYYNEGAILFENIDANVLEYFELSDPIAFKTMADQLKDMII